MLSRLPLLAFAASASAFTYTIGVGKDQVTGLPGVGFDPSRTVTAVNDTIVFSFLQGAHRVVQSNVTAPCVAAGTYDTGLVQVPNGTVSGGPSFTFPVANSSEILYFSDIADDNCLQGAVFCVNTDETSLTASCHAYHAAALALGSSQGVATSSRPATNATMTSTTSTPAVTTTTSKTTGTSPSASTSQMGAAGRMSVGGAVGAVLVLAGGLAIL